MKWALSKFLQPFMRPIPITFIYKAYFLLKQLNLYNFPYDVCRAPQKKT